MAGPQRRGSGAGGGERRDRKGRDGRRAAAEKTAYVERVVAINRVAKVVKGGRRFSFTALVVVGDGDGTVGVGYGKAKEVPAAIAKGVEEAKKHFFKVPRIQGTIPHPITGREGRGRRPPEAGFPRYRRHRRWPGACRAGVRRRPRHPVEVARLVNAINIVHATVAALKGLQRPEEIAARRGLPLEDVAPAALLRGACRGARRCVDGTPQDHADEVVHRQQAEPA